MVAGFIGWPPMNFLTGKIVRNGDAFAFEAKSDSLPLMDVTEMNWPPCVGRSLTMGIRPEAIRLGRTGSRTDGSLLMEVVQIEELGGMRLVTMRRNEWNIVGQVNTEPGLSEGQQVEATWDMQRTYWFDPANGLTLRGGVPAG
jgi:ABC-type sugar transport system ATPase subunit